MSTECHVRSISGRVHLVPDDHELTTRCGVNLCALELTEDPVTCRHCLGARRIVPRPASVHEELQTAHIREEIEQEQARAVSLPALLARSDALLEEVEQVNLLAAGPERDTMAVIDGAWPPITAALSHRIDVLRQLLELEPGRAERTPDALDRIYQIQNVLFRRLRPGWLPVDDDEEEASA